MSRLAQRHHVVESTSRRALGAIRLVDAASGLPLTLRARISPRTATIAQGPGQPPISLRPDRVRLQQNHSGLYVLAAAPLLDTYAHTFDPPPPPPETTPAPLALAFDVFPDSPKYLPRSFVFTLPRSHDRTAENAVARPLDVPLFLSAAAPVGTADTILRLTLTRQNAPAPGVLVAIYRSPRQNGQPAIGTGLSDWRGALAGETMIIVPQLPRYRPGSGNAIIETEQAIEIEATRDAAFQPDRSPPPDPGRLAAANEDGLQRVSWNQIEPTLEIAPRSQPVSIVSGQQHVARAALP